MQKSRCVGLLGGLGVGAANHYYSVLAKESADRGMELDLVMAHAETPRALVYAGAGDREGMAAYVNGFVERMRSAGAEFVVIPSVTSNFCVRELRAIAQLPVIGLYEAVAKEAARRGIRRVAVFGTRFVMQSNMFGFVPELEFVHAHADEIEYVHSTYLRLALDCRGTEADYRELRELALRLIERERLDAVVLGGTDLAVIFNESNTDFPHLDCATAHLGAVVDAMFGGPDTAG